MNSIYKFVAIVFLALCIFGCSHFKAPQVHDEESSSSAEQSVKDSDEGAETPDPAKDEVEDESSLVSYAYHIEPNIPPTYIDGTQESPLSSITSDAITSMRMCFPMVGEYELTGDEIAVFADELSSLRLKNTIPTAIYGSPGLCTIEIEFENGEYWLLQFPQSHIEYNAITIGFDENSYLWLEGDENITFNLLYYTIEEKATASFPDTLVPFKNISKDDLAFVGYEYFTYENGSEFLELSDEKVGQLIELLRSIEIDPQSGTHDLVSTFGGGFTGLTGSNNQFLLEFVDGSSLYIGAGGGGFYIDGVLYQPTEESEGTLARLNTFYLGLD